MRVWQIKLLWQQKLKQQFSSTLYTTYKRKEVHSSAIPCMIGVYPDLNLTFKYPFLLLDFSRIKKNINCGLSTGKRSRCDWLGGLLNSL